MLEASPKKLCKALIFLVHVFKFCGTPSNSREERGLETIVNEQSSSATADFAKPTTTHRQVSPDPYSWVGFRVGERHYCTVNLEIFILTIFL